MSDVRMVKLSYYVALALAFTVGVGFERHSKLLMSVAFISCVLAGCLHDLALHFVASKSIKPDNGSETK